MKKSSNKTRKEVDNDYFKRKRQDKNKAISLRRKRRERLTVKNSTIKL